MNSGDLSTAVDVARRHAPFLAMLLDRESQLLENLDGALADPLATARMLDEDLPVSRRLRLERRRLALLVALGDLSGRFDLTRVTHLLSDFADDALDRAIRAAIRERTPDAEPQGFAAIALGKLGSRELNYSSDIDPILIFDPATLPCRPREAVEEAAVRIGRRVIELLQSRDADGYVMRVDLRLRPSPEVTPIALPVEAAISYYESQALPWERAAFIRTRACAGDRALGEHFLAAIRPFVWRRAVDYGTIREIRDISRRIRDHYAQAQAFGPGYDLKRGRGGIREIEFFAQIHQLIHGGRDPELRVPATRDALAALAGAGRIDPEDAAALTAAYVEFRTVEHRLQMVDDLQTHMLPAGAEALDNVAALHGLDDGAALIARLRPHVERVGRVYDGLAGEEEPRLPADPATLEARLKELGFDHPAGALRIVEGWRGGGYPALRSPQAREALEALLPGLIDAFAQAPDSTHAITRFDAMLSRLPSAINFFRLLEAQPGLRQLMSAILCHAPTLAEQLGRRAELLDGLIDASALEPVAEVPELIDAMAARERGADYQWQLEHVRRLVGEKRFALGAQIVAGASDPIEVSYGYARIAEAAIEVLAAATIAEFERAHGRVPGSELVILALGRMGGQALTHASDLDLVYLFTGDYAAESDGAKPLGAVTYYNRLAQRVTAALSVPTAAGPLYDVDTRLRPSGAQGPLVVSLDAFERYQREDAWTWEHMALTRARPIFGSSEARGAVQAIVDAVLNGARPERDILADAVKMRDEMAAHKPPAGPLDAKLLPGGLVDLEFAVHVLQLRHKTAFTPRLREAIRLLAEQGLMSATMIEAHALLSRLLVTLRLVAPDAQPPGETTQALIARAMGLASWDAVVASLERTRQEVADCWAAIRAGG
ncbi:glutamate-ammonia-ligase adenylyltransferase [Sphingomonas naasensis]|uniref:Bifunctional [glutamine synthetase] adenylyltransferase/[glutamine synthetase]-adenylyl-L-tyrosine phosphorylase n=1 Tax=Sphingomonas naasensis TaxID=1344951 RepID=A0A4S1WRQ1_9SPHN|nr:bifunctional [glutamine synthetase] adenylyltransferase/[glutamine synthetase]-adenylyl-L-tyrosine phosphorylase [Sphingomonas naasensis]NIJ20601.1 glutamate-ammonia-ligase adenylyltransferase [Sphingomonas naasensis]TGX44680.1 bifunctional [glutamine synthetase] adenylyltransferase/[glutamine synthetase]-adenylyl-L-tyrosine phosphorylase [Sphingomonas naasensis]